MQTNSTDTKQWLKDSVVSGSAAALLSAATLSLRSKIDEDSFAGGINGPSQWFWGTEEGRERRATLRHTAVGYAIHHSTSIMWGAIFERLCGEQDRDRLAQRSAARIIVEAAGMSALAFVVDYGFTPKRFQPGFEKHVSTRSMVMVYTAVAAGFALTSLLRRRAARSQRP